jgi:PTS system mannose-specific IIA component
MLGLLVITHGRVAEELVDAALTIVGRLEAMEAVSIDWNDDPRAARTRIDQALGRVDRGAGVLVLTDMFGGTPTNIALSLPDSRRVEIVTGVNLSMLIAFAGHRQDGDLGEAARAVADKGREGIQRASALLPRAEDPSGQSR